MSKKPKAGRDPNSIVPFVVSGLVILATGIGISIMLARMAQPGDTNNAGSLVIGAAIVFSGVLFITAWAKRK